MASHDVRLPLEGLHCASCVRRAETAIGGVEGVSGTTVNLAAMRADVALAPGADRAAVLAGIDAAVAKAGYAVATRPIALSIDGMHCASCVGRVERALAAVPGVREAVVNLATGRADVRAAAFVEAAALAAAVATVGSRRRRATRPRRGALATRRPRCCATSPSPRP